MLVDTTTQVSDGVLQFDVCIVGSGSAGFEEGDAKPGTRNFAGQSDPGGTAADDTDIKLQYVIRKPGGRVDYHGASSSVAAVGKPAEKVSEAAVDSDKVSSIPEILSLALTLKPTSPD